MKWFWQKGSVADPVLEKLGQMEKRIGGIEVIQTELLRRVTPPPKAPAYEYKFTKNETTSKIG